MNRFNWLWIPVCTALIFGSRPALADDCRSAFQSEYLQEIEEGLPRNMERVRINSCEISRSDSGQVRLSVSGSVLVKANRFLRSRLSGSIVVVLTNKCTAARVERYRLAFLPHLPTGWLDDVGSKVPGYRNRPPLLGYCS